jgi:hypothetical protein
MRRQSAREADDALGELDYEFVVTVLSSEPINLATLSRPGGRATSSAIFNATAAVAGGGEPGLGGGKTGNGGAGGAGGAGAGGVKEERGRDSPPPAGGKGNKGKVAAKVNTGEVRSPPTRQKQGHSSNDPHGGAYDAVVRR